MIESEILHCTYDFNNIFVPNLPHYFNRIQEPVYSYLFDPTKWYRRDVDQILGHVVTQKPLR